MNTPGHYILNLALLGQTIAPEYNTAIALGAILPDIPIFGFYFVAKFIYQIPETKIWTEVYYEPFWQNLGLIIIKKSLRQLANYNNQLGFACFDF